MPERMAVGAVVGLEGCEKLPGRQRPRVGKGRLQQRLASLGFGVNLLSQVEETAARSLEKQTLPSSSKKMSELHIC